MPGLTRSSREMLFVPHPHTTLIAKIALKLFTEVRSLATDAAHPTSFSTQIGPYSVFVVFAVLRDSHRRPPFLGKNTSALWVRQVHSRELQANKYTRYSDAIHVHR